MLRGLLEGAQYNSEAGQSARSIRARARTKQGRGVIKEIQYLWFSNYTHDATSGALLELFFFYAKIKKGGAKQQLREEIFGRFVVVVVVVF